MIKINTLILVASLSIVITSCGGNSKPSIKENSNHNSGATKKDFSSTSPEVLYKHILAHYDLEEFELGKDKLTSLLINHPELTDSLQLNELKHKFDLKLIEIKEKQEALAELERKKRLPEDVIKNLHIYNDNEITIHKDKTSPKFETNECFYIYFTKNKQNKLNLFFKIRYISTADYLNIENIIVTADKLDYTLSGEVIKEQMKGKKKTKSELLIIQIKNTETMNIAKAIANGTDVVGLYVGSASYKKREITLEQRNAFRNILDAYLYMGGENFK